jgi:hypothetical protein
MSSKQREALSDACYAMFNFLKTHYGSCYEEMANALDKAKAALAEPLKNCEVGTAEEQSVRFYDYCLTHSKDSVVCLDCPLCDKSEMCEFVWAQLPYESGVKHDR